MKAYAAMGLPHAGDRRRAARRRRLHAHDIELIDIGNAQTGPGYGGCDRRGHRGGRRVRTAGPAKVEEANAAEGQPPNRVT